MSIKKLMLNQAKRFYKWGLDYQCMEISVEGSRTE